MAAPSWWVPVRWPSFGAASARSISTGTRIASVSAPGTGGRVSVPSSSSGADTALGISKGIIGSINKVINKLPDFINNLTAGLGFDATLPVANAVPGLGIVTGGISLGQGNQSAPQIAQAAGGIVSGGIEVGAAAGAIAADAAAAALGVIAAPLAFIAIWATTSSLDKQAHIKRAIQEYKNASRNLTVGIPQMRAATDYLERFFDGISSSVTRDDALAFVKLASDAARQALSAGAQLSDAIVHIRTGASAEGLVLAPGKDVSGYYTVTQQATLDGYILAMATEDILFRNGRPLSLNWPLTPFASTEPILKNMAGYFGVAPVIHTQVVPDPNNPDTYIEVQVQGDDNDPLNRGSIEVRRAVGPQGNLLFNVMRYFAEVRPDTVSSFFVQRVRGLGILQSIGFMTPPDTAVLRSSILKLAADERDATQKAIDEYNAMLSARGGNA